MEDLDEEIANKKAKFSDLKRKIEGKTNKLTKIQKRLNQVLYVEESIADLVDQTAALEDRVDIVEGRVEDVETQATSTEEDLGMINVEREHRNREEALVDTALKQFKKMDQELKALKALFHSKD